MAPALPSTFTVSSLTRVIKELLEGGFSEVTVEGELSGVKMAPSGHLYFTLKDESAVLAGAFFKARERGLDFNPADGDQVRITGRITVYEPRGTYQLTAATLVRSGQGALLARLEELKRKLAAEGLFDSQRKKTIPSYPRTVVLITSPGAAALQDMLRVFATHGAPFKIRLLPVLVQGAEAPGQIARAIHLASRQNLGDVVVAGRGGGSLEDLSAFSAEEVVRAVAACRIPIISAVGHEVDIPLSDLAADLRAPTPTRAAEVLCAGWLGLREALEESKTTLINAMSGRLDQARLLIKPFTGQYLSDSIERILLPIRQRLDDAAEALVENLRDRILETSQKVQLLKTGIEARSPGALLEKGWSLVTDDQGRVVTSSQALAVGQNLHIRLAQGRIITEVKELQNE